MKKEFFFRTLILTVLIVVVACKKNNPKRLIDERNFKMGFTSWNYGPNLEDVNNTYDFIFEHGDIYAEHLDDKIPWDSWLNGTPLPAEFIANINGKVARKPADTELLLSISFLNNARNEIKEDFDGTLPAYEALNDSAIENAYVDHVIYLLEAFHPNYLVIAIESNDLLVNRPDLWAGYRALMKNVRARIKELYPTILITESLTLHNWYAADVTNPNEFIAEVDELADEMDFVAVSFYPFFKGLNNRKDFQKAFDFLHEHTSKPIAFVETSHLANELTVDAFNLSIESDEKEQETYLSTLFINAHNHDYKFVIWWAHRDFDALWETFPDDLKDLGKIWRDTGLLDEGGKERKSMELWREIFSK
jgi:hypothetical protein